MPSFRYCLNASTIRPTPLLEKIRIASEAGYEGIELWHDEIDAHLAAGGLLSDIQQALRAFGLAVPTTIYLRDWCDTTQSAHETALEECRRRMDIAAALGAPHCIASPAAGAVDVALAGRNYRELLELGMQHGVKPSMEYLGFVEQLNTLESALEILHIAGHPAGTVIIDPFHAFRGGGAFESLAKLRPEQIAISHFNDTPAAPPREQQHDRDRVMPGEGHLDLARWIRLLKQIDYSGWLSLELFNETLWQVDPREVARIGLEKMRAIAESA
jgi:sugar phosphate isomerase/epimerase